LLVVHGWGRKENVVPSSRVEHVNVGADLRGLAVGEFVWDREGRSELAALASDGTVHLVQALTLVLRQTIFACRPSLAQPAYRSTRVRSRLSLRM
jgi:hypothetical protein